MSTVLVLYARSSGLALAAAVVDADVVAPALPVGRSLVVAVGDADTARPPDVTFPAAELATVVVEAPFDDPLRVTDYRIFTETVVTGEGPRDQLSLRALVDGGLQGALDGADAVTGSVGRPETGNEIVVELWHHNGRIATKVVPFDPGESGSRDFRFVDLPSTGDFVLVAARYRPIPLLRPIPA
jgi:hypothetical protein